MTLKQIHSKISFEWWGIINIIITWWEYTWIITLRITWLFLFSNAPLIYSSPIKAAGVNLPAILTWIVTKFSTRLVIRDVTDSLMNLAFYLVTPDTCLPCERLWQISTPVVLWCDSLRHRLVQWSSLKMRRIDAIISHVKVHRLTAATELRGGEGGQCTLVWPCDDGHGFWRRWTWPRVTIIPWEPTVSIPLWSSRFTATQPPWSSRQSSKVRTLSEQKTDRSSWMNKQWSIVRTPGIVKGNNSLRIKSFGLV